MYFAVNPVSVSNDTELEWAYEIQETIKFIPKSGSNESVIELQLPRKAFNKHTEQIRHTIRPVDTNVFFREYVGFAGANIEIDVSMTLDYGLLKIQDLISFAERSRHFLTLAQNAFARTHSAKTLKIDIEDWNVTRRVSSTDSTISIKHYDLILSLLKNFGHLIPSLDITFNYELNANDEKALEISKYVNFYCADSLIKLNIDSHQANLFEEMKKPFTKVEHFSITGSAIDLGNFNHSFSELFPAVKSLDLVRFQPINVASIDENLEHLETLSINVFKNEEIRAFPLTELKKFFVKNPQISNLNLWHANPKFLLTVNQTLTNLRNLTLTSYHDFDTIDMKKNQNFTIIFGEVTYFAVVGYKPDIPEYINVPKLVEFRGELQTNNNIDKIINFLKTKQHLRRITIKLVNVDQDTVARRLRNEFGDQWVLTTSKNEVSLERHD